MVRDIIYRVLSYAVVVAIIIGGFRVYRQQTGFTLTSEDRSMDTEKFPAGKYKVDTSYAKPSQLRTGNIIAYVEPHGITRQRLGRVLAIEGQIVAIDGNTVSVDGKKLPDTPDTIVHYPEFRVPRGCVFVLADRSSIGADSLTVGPVPFYYVLGRVE